MNKPSIYTMRTGKWYNQAGEYIKTFGMMYIDERFFAYTLEDIVRKFGEKVKHQTAIPEGDYFGTISFSQKFKKEMPIIYTEGDKYTIKKGGIAFTGVRMHWGIDETKTDGCILIGRNFDRVAGKLYDGCTDELTALLKSKGGDFNFRIANKFTA